MSTSALWTMSAQAEADQTARVAIFKKIEPATNWKLAIDAVIQEADFDACNQAAIWFTGGALTIERRLVNGWVRVTGRGYYAEIGA